MSKQEILAIVFTVLMIGSMMVYSLGAMLT